MPWSPRVVLLLLLVGGALPGLAVAVLPERVEGRLAAAPVPAPGVLSTVLEWDRRRAAAYARGDPDALTGLYAPGSRTGARDVEVLRSYAARGLVVRGMRTQVLAVRELHRKHGLLVVALRDRVLGAVAVGRGVRVALPVGRPVRRTVTMVRRGGRWLVSEVVRAR